ncbi:MAG: hypothetical protein ACTSYX_04800, partial [Candidatus Thorarchaeota archaeon]
MTAVLETYGDGWVSIKDVKFWILLENNAFSVFTSADETAVAVLNVYTSERPEIGQQGKKLDFDPEGGGYDLPLYTAEGQKVSSVPDWLQDEYAVENLKRLQTVRFPITVIEAAPTTVSFFDWSRVECQAVITLGIDVLLFGQWEELRPYHKVEPPEPDKTWWDMLQDWLEENSPSLMGILLLVIGLVFTVIVFRFVPDWRMKLVAVAVVWLILLLWFAGWELGGVISKWTGQSS